MSEPSYISARLRSDPRGGDGRIGLGWRAATRRLWAPADSSYAAAKFEDARPVSVRMLVAAVVATLGLWAWDWAVDPAHAPLTMLYRLAMTAVTVAGGVALFLPIPRALLVVLAQAAVLTTEAVYFLMLARIDGGFLLGGPGLIFFFIGHLIVCLPFAWRVNAIGSLLLALVPTALALAGAIPPFDLLTFNLLVVPAASFTLIGHVLFDLMYARLYASRREIERLATVDDLSGLATRRHFLNQAEAVLAVLRRHGRPVAVLLVDIDRFKLVNDTHGHAAGDATIRAVGGILLARARASDLLGRLGGEEFALFLPETAREGALVLANRLRADIAETTVETPETLLRVTVSIGLAATAAADADTRLDALLAQSDKALYRAKQQGRDRVVAPD